MAGGIAVLSISAFFVAAFVAVGIATEFHPVTGIAPAAVATSRIVIATRSTRTASKTMPSMMKARWVGTVAPEISR